MKWQGFRRSENVEDDRDLTKPLKPEFEQKPFFSLNEWFKLRTSKLAKMVQPRDKDDATG